MMAATFRTRPWLLASTVRPAFSPASNTSRILLANMQQSRQAATHSRRIHPHYRTALNYSKSQANLQEATTSIVEGFSKGQGAAHGAESAVLAPGTLVPGPIMEVDGWLRRLAYCKNIVMQRFVDRAQIFQQTWQLKPSFFSRARFRAERKGIVEAALKLHGDMSRCLAMGGPAEKARLSQICVPKLHRSLIAAIETRPRGKSYKWERIKTLGKPFWPRIVDHKWVDIDMGFTQSFRQAVVGIKSKQRLTEFDAKGTERGTKEMVVMEYVVLWRSVDKEHLTQEDWQIYGTLKETSYQEMLKEKEILKAVADMLSKQKVDETKKRLKASKKG